MNGAALFPLVALARAAVVLASTVTYNWEVTWVWGSPDGYERPIIGINNSWPCPMIEVSQGDTVIVNLVNKLGNETTGMHFHGLSQMNTTFMDGSVGSSQCPLPPDHSMTYSFTVCQKPVQNGIRTEEITSSRKVDRPIHLALIGVSNPGGIVDTRCTNSLEEDHSHSMGQYPDGFRGPLIIHDPRGPYTNDYDVDEILTISDW